MGSSGFRNAPLTAARVALSDHNTKQPVMPQHRLMNATVKEHGGKERVCRRGRQGPPARRHLVNSIVRLMSRGLYATHPILSHSVREPSSSKVTSPGLSIRSAMKVALRRGYCWTTHTATPGALTRTGQELSAVISLRLSHTVRYTASLSDTHTDTPKSHKNTHTNRQRDIGRTEQQCTPNHTRIHTVRYTSATCVRRSSGTSETRRMCGRHSTNKLIKVLVTRGERRATVVHGTCEGLGPTPAGLEDLNNMKENLVRMSETPL